MGKPKALLKHLPLEDASAPTIKALMASAKALSDQIGNADHTERKDLYRRTLVSVILSDQEISVSLTPGPIGIDTDDAGPITITQPLTIKRRGQEMKMVIGEKQSVAANRNPGLIMLVAKAHALRNGLEDGSISSILEFADRHNIDHGDAKRMVPLGYLAPDIVEAILAGHQPADLTVQQLRSGYDLPIRWAEQRIHLGVPPQT